MSARRLGRGLEALLGPSTVAEARADGSLRRLQLSAIRPNPFQPRREFPEAAMSELIESLRTSGLLQPIVVRPGVNGMFEVIAGERRLRAAQHLGWQDIDVVIREADDRTLLTLALVENLQRDDLSPIDEARGYQRLMSEFHASQGEVATLVGRARPTIANAVRLLQLPDEVQALLHRGKITTGHARALLQLAHATDMIRAARLVVERGLSVREVEEQARGRPAAPRALRGRRAGRRPDPAVQRIEDALRRRLQTDVFVVTRGKGGRISISFYSNDDLLRLLEMILGREYQA